ncbi:MAG: GLPGLI family protein [bacterium]|nr:GLPGLI family protein [bacterium]
MIIKRSSALSFLVLIFLQHAAQLNYAKITYERKTNLYKKFKKNNDIQRWIKEEDKIKTDYFELFVNDTCSVFQPQASELKENYSWTTAKNTVYQYPNQNKRYLIKTMWGEEMHLTDSLVTRRWQITESSRNIAGFQCRKAVWQANDSTRIYAWFSYDLVPSTGPESFRGLPGTILGLATEDGGVVYFAKKVELISAEQTQFIPPKKKKIYKIPELKAELTKQYGHEKWFKEVLDEEFGIW